LWYGTALVAPGPTPNRLTADSFGDVYERHAESVFRVVHQVLRDRGQAEDVTQEVFLSFWRNPDRFDPDRGELGAYLRVLARSRALDAVRAASAARRAHDRLEYMVTREPRVEVEPPVLLASEIERSELRAAVSELPGAQRDAVALSFWGELSTREIAARCELPHGTVKSRVRLGLRKLRERVDEERLAA
jgi:RNA polymerase sigma-70 factor (ECF subfamily)